MTNDSNASTATTATANATTTTTTTATTIAATTPPASTPSVHQNASPCITKTIPPHPPKPPQPPTESPLAARATPPLPAEVMQTTAPSLFTLTPTQLKALDLLLSGLPDLHI